MHFLRRVMQVSLIFGAIVGIVGLLFSIQRWPGVYELLLAAHAFTLVFWLCAILEIFTIKPLLPKTKLVWMVILLPLPILSLLFYHPLLFLLIEWGYLKVSKKKLYPITS